jgi:hypothetical protein
LVRIVEAASPRDDLRWIVFMPTSVLGIDEVCAISMYVFGVLFVDEFVVHKAVLGVGRDVLVHILDRSLDSG